MAKKKPHMSYEEHLDEVTTLVRLQQAFQINAQVIQAASQRLQMLRELTR